MGELFLFYIIIVNLISFGRMSADKRKSRRRAYRISERELLLLALIGGSAGVWAAMYMFRHKTKHKLFVITVPVLLGFQGLLVFFIYRESFFNFFQLGV
ncbi:DUF1294 domain-containing protein [Alteribacillus sp. JSM 102045]|uniref:DUF1294 domain-containing protein n=1 Tax=Alteribacillus sp. JSM 102045 TaxID=1562101 RepID=UPI0035C246C5